MSRVHPNQPVLARRDLRPAAQIEFAPNAAHYLAVQRSFSHDAGIARMISHAMFAAGGFGAGSHFLFALTNSGFISATIGIGLGLLCSKTFAEFHRSRTLFQPSHAPSMRHPPSAAELANGAADSMLRGAWLSAAQGFERAYEETPYHNCRLPYAVLGTMSYLAAGKQPNAKSLITDYEEKLSRRILPSFEQREISRLAAVVSGETVAATDARYAAQQARLYHGHWGSLFDNAMTPIRALEHMSAGALATKPQPAPPTTEPLTPAQDTPRNIEHEVACLEALTAKLWQRTISWRKIFYPSALIRRDAQEVYNASFQTIAATTTKPNVPPHLQLESRAIAATITLALLAYKPGTPFHAHWSTAFSKLATTTPSSIHRTKLDRLAQVAQHIATHGQLETCINLEYLEWQSHHFTKGPHQAMLAQYANAERHAPA